MKLTFPYMGPIQVYRRLLEAFGHEVILPAKPTQRTFDLGTKHSPEFLCFPFKCLMGTYIEAVERGAGGVVTTGGDGACRAGFYAEIHQRILKSMGYDVPFFVLESVLRRPGAFLGHLNVLKGSYSWAYLIRTLWFCYQLIAALDRLESRVRILRAYETTPGDISRAWEKIRQMFDECRGPGEIREAEKAANELLDALTLRRVPLNERIRVGIVGEIYVAMESHANLDLEETLARLGVEVVNSQYVSHWLQHNTKFAPWQRTYTETILEKATPYLKIDLGGHDKENIAHMILFRDQGVDGIIHLMPFACLPELITQSIIPRIARDLGIPILSLAIDEQRGTANNQTRIEAFIDLVRNRKAERTACPGNAGLPLTAH